MPGEFQPPKFQRQRTHYRRFFRQCGGWAKRPFLRETRDDDGARENRGHSDSSTRLRINVARGTRRDDFCDSAEIGIPENSQRRRRSIVFARLLREPRSRGRPSDGNFVAVRQIGVAAACRFYPDMLPNTLAHSCRRKVDTSSSSSRVSIRCGNRLSETGRSSSA